MLTRLCIIFYLYLLDHKQYYMLVTHAIRIVIFPTLLVGSLLDT